MFPKISIFLLNYKTKYLIFQKFLNFQKLQNLKNIFKLNFPKIMLPIILEFSQITKFPILRKLSIIPKEIEFSQKFQIFTKCLDFKKF